jgi:uncharacterized C2H2 Zn-finger protein
MGKNGNGNGNGNKSKPAKIITCPICEMVFWTIADLQTHIAVNHPGTSGQ